MTVTADFSPIAKLKAAAEGGLLRQSFRTNAKGFGYNPVYEDLDADVPIFDFSDLLSPDLTASVAKCSDAAKSFIQAGAFKLPFDRCILIFTGKRQSIVAFSESKDDRITFKLFDNEHHYPQWRQFSYYIECTVGSAKIMVGQRPEGQVEDRFIDEFKNDIKLYLTLTMSALTLLNLGLGTFSQDGTAQRWQALVNRSSMEDFLAELKKAR